MKEIKLINFIEEISMGPFGSDIRVDNFISNGVPVLNGSNLTSHKLVEDEFKYISEEKANKLGKANARRGDIVVTHRGTLGQVAYIPSNSKHERYVISQSQFRVRFKDTINPIYFAYLMKSDYGQKKLLSFKNHVGVPALAQATTNFKNLELYLHDIPEQQNIATILSLLDNKIELNNTINAELEQMTRALYNYWFVQFDFPNAKGKPYKSSGGKMVYNESLKREVPDGWKVKTLSELYTFFTRGISPKYIEVNGTQVINQRCIRNKTIDFSFCRRHDHLQRPVSKLVTLGDILVNSTGVGTLGRIAIVKRLENELTTTDSHVTIVRIDPEKANPLFIGVTMLERQPEIEQLGEGSTGQTELSRENLGKLKLLLPKRELQDAFEHIVSPLFQKMANNEQENQQLAALRDCLLPMLMNGQIKVNCDIKADEQNLSSPAAQGTPLRNIAQLNIPANKKAFAKQILAGRIISKFKEDPNFTDIKFQKIQFLAEHIIEADLNLNYYYQAAGPYDNVFMHTIYSDLKKNKWYDCKDRKFTALEKQAKIEEYYLSYFGSATGQLDKLFGLLSNATEAKSEIIATVYAVWNNFIIEGKSINDDELIQSFYNWSERKHQYTEAQIGEGLQWIKENKLEPTGFGKLIKKAKNKK